MIFILLIIDILINNYSKYTSFFFLVYLYHKPYKYYLLTALLLDLIIFNSFYNIIILSIIYLLNKIFTNLNSQNIWVYLGINLFNYIVYIILSNLFMLNNIKVILFNIGFNLLLNIIFYLLMYNKKYKY